MTAVDTSTGTAAPLTVLVIVDDPVELDTYTEWLSAFEVRKAGDGTGALDQLDAAVDVVLLDGGLTDPASSDLLGQIRARQIGCQIALLSDVAVAAEIHRLDVDEYVPRPVSAEELRATVERLDDRSTLIDTMETYLTLVERKRRFERRYDGDELSEQSHYRSLTGELVARRRQIDTLLVELAAGRDGGEGDADGDGGTVESNGRQRDELRGKSVSDSVSEQAVDGSRPLYDARPREFYGLWVLALLTYGVGDVVSTSMAVFTVDGLEEGNPVVDSVLGSLGLPGFLVLKVLVFLVLLSVSVQGARTHDQFSYYWPPVVATLLGVSLTVWNVRLILLG